MQKILLIAFLFLGMSTSLFAEDVKSESTLEKETQTEQTISQKINHWFEPKVTALEKVLFWDPFTAIGIHDPVVYDENGKPLLDEQGKPITKDIPFIVVWLVLGAAFFTVRMKFINITGIKHSIDLIRGKYDKPGDVGEVSHFQALATALSGTVGLGNIAGVAIAITVGGPGATFWMIVAGIMGMSLKFTEVTLGVKYRNISKAGIVSGGPMFYLEKALKEKKLLGFSLWPLGKVLAVTYAVLMIGASIGGGNMFQSNQTFMQFELIEPAFVGHGAWVGMALAIIVGVVIIGGIKSIAKVTEKVVPIMAGIYVLAALVVIGVHYTEIPAVFGIIIDGAFNADALKGGFLGVLIVGFQRASFSNEAGVGSATIAHSAVKTDEPISEGFVALVEPVIDTVLICTMTALVIVFTGYYTPELANGMSGSQLTSAAFGSVISWFPYILAFAIMLFAISTMITWAYYGLNSFKFLFGGLFKKFNLSQKTLNYTFFFIFLSFTVIGAAAELGAVVAFADMMILTMAFPNIIGLLILAPEVYGDLKIYIAKLKSGEIKKFED